MFDLTFDLSIFSYLVPLCFGACVYTISDSGMKYTNVYNVLESYQITVALMVPSMLLSLRPYFNEITLPELRYSLFCGEALFKDVATEWMQCVPNATVVNVYGPTEATIFCTVYELSDKDNVSSYNEVVSIGHTMEGTEAIVIDEHGEIITDNTKGELCLHGDQLTKGYLDDAKNKAAFVKLNDKRYYRTGDIVYKDGNGNFMYCGRADQQVKIQGYRIELSEIEYHLRLITGSANIVVLAVTRAGALASLEAVYDDGRVDEDLVMAELRTKLPAYMMPLKMHFVAAFPLNANGKTDRNALKKMIDPL